MARVREDVKRLDAFLTLLDEYDVSLEELREAHQRHNKIAGRLNKVAKELESAGYLEGDVSWGIPEIVTADDAFVEKNRQVAQELVADLENAEERLSVELEEIGETEFSSADEREKEEESLKWRLESLRKVFG